MMGVSLNEIEVTLRKAALGAGLPYGLAEDAGRAGAWLAARGLPGVEDCLSALERVESTGLNGLQCREEGSVLRIDGPATALSVGPMLADRLRVAGMGEAPVRIEVEVVDSPLLCLAALAGAFEECGHPFVLAWGPSFLPRVNVRGNADGLQISRDVPEGSGRLTAILGSDSEGADFETGPDLNGVLQGSLETGVVVDTETWGRVNRLSARTLVPATEFSRLAGAGAGTVDND